MLKRLVEYEGLEHLGIQVKFTKPEFLDSFLDGNLFMNNFRSFIDLENQTKIKGQGDKLEAGFVFRGNNATIYYKDKEVGRANFAEFVERYDKAEKLPVFCFARFESKDLAVIEENEEGVQVKINLNEEDQNAFLKDFGPTAVVLPGDFYERVANTCKDKGIHFAAGQVAYLDYNHHNDQRRKSFDAGSVDMFFWKDDFFKYQRECRVVLTDTFIDNGMMLNIGNMREKAITLDTSELFTTATFEIKYKDIEKLASL
ncbi:hypothetical protein [Peribacillus frigoritolerans]|uniref:hypothetical protein n=1 Tax=Peribacillus frigoritolerans TaxID=450367 RepID=UPI003D0627B7